MIVNPVRYGSGVTKTVTVTIKLSASSSVRFYYVSNGTYLTKTTSNIGKKTVDVDAGSIFAAEITTEGVSFSDLTNCTKQKQFSVTSNGTYLGIFQANA